MNKTILIRISTFLFSFTCQNAVVRNTSPGIVLGIKFPDGAYPSGQEGIIKLRTNQVLLTNTGSVRIITNLSMLTQRRLAFVKATGAQTNRWPMRKS